MMSEKALIQEKLDKVLGCLLHLQQPDFMQKEGAVQVDKDKGIYARDFGMEYWDWPQGVGLYGLAKTMDLQGHREYEEYMKQWFDKHIESGLPSKNVNTTTPYLALLALAQQTNNQEYKALCLARANWLMEGLPKTEEGGFQHVTTGFAGKDSIILNESELWIDTLFMAVLFLAKAGVVFENKAFLNEAAKQMLIHVKYLYEKQNGLFYHGWSFDRRDNFAGVFWARGNAWFAYGVLELLETLQGYLDGGTEAFLRDTFTAQMKALHGLQAESGLWHTILTDASSYEEVSGTAGIAAAMLKGVRLGVLAAEYLPGAAKAVRAVIQNIRPDGLVQNVSAGTGIGLDVEHYKKIVLAPMSYGQAMAALALIEALALAQ